MSLRRPARFVALLAAALVAGLVAPGSAQALPCSSGAVLVLESFHVVAEPESKVARRGQKLDVLVTVTRPAHKDPFGFGVQFDPPTSRPEPDANVGISVWTGERTYFWALGMTDENGEAKLTLRIPKNAELGDADVTASAYKWIKRDCPDILETGFREYERFFTVVP